ncbi:MAG: c-type cytochrome, partial [Gemmataceae bacterium]|nr:c-type cytochrome [Gemmataceae bacterium]
DKDGDGKADERRDLLSGLGLKPEDNPPRLHCANGVTVGHDGWLYLALGDHGCTVERPEGDRLIYNGGGILRCRPDGRGLHVFATGLRNIYDVALDAELNVFVRDNENDGGDYMVRVCHSFFGADHGYPYLYKERPVEALSPLADLGRGSSAGGVCYLETAFPLEYRGNLFFCEWGRSLVRHRPVRKGSGFEHSKEYEFAAGADNDPYGFKPTDVVVQRDGSLLVSDWADGQRPKRGRGRIYCISNVKPAKPAKPGANRIAQLDSPSYYARLDAQSAIEKSGDNAADNLRLALQQNVLGPMGRLHAIWILAHLEGQGALADLFRLAKSDLDERVRAQAVRAIADLADPVLSKGRLDAGRGDPKLAQDLAALANDQDRRVLLEIVIALGRLRWLDAPAWLGKKLVSLDPTFAHAAMQTLRRADNWPAVLTLLDQSYAVPMRGVALLAVGGQYEAALVDGLVERLQKEPNADRRQEYAVALTRVWKKPGKWVYWGYRPPPRPANSLAWERTEEIDKALDRMLADPDREVRREVLRCMWLEKIPARLKTLGQWLSEETGGESDALRVSLLLLAMRDQPAQALRPYLEVLILDKKHAHRNRSEALTMFLSGLGDSSQDQLLSLAEKLEDGPVLAVALEQLGQRPRLKSTPLLLAKLNSDVAAVRAAALRSLADLEVREADKSLAKHLEDAHVGVRTAAAYYAGRLTVAAATDALLKLTRDTDLGVRSASLEALRRLREPRAVPLAVGALEVRETRIAALECLRDLGNPDHLTAIGDAARKDPSADVLALVFDIYTRERTGGNLQSLGKLFELQGDLGIVGYSLGAGPLAAESAKKLPNELPLDFGDFLKLTDQLVASPANRHALTAKGVDLRIRPSELKTPAAEETWLAHSFLSMPEKTSVQFLTGSSGPMRIWLNGKVVFQRTEQRSFVPDADRFDAVLKEGSNQLVVQFSARKGPAEFHLRFRRKSAVAEHEKLLQAALGRPGEPDKGRKLFFDVAKSQCLKCHRLGNQGEHIGPDLSGIGKRFARVHLIESILEPSRTITPSFETLFVELKDGRVLNGVRVAETETTLTLGDNQGKKYDLPRAQIEMSRQLPLSTMPDGLERPLSTDDFVNLIAFLASQK